MIGLRTLAVSLLLAVATTFGYGLWRQAKATAEIKAELAVVKEALATEKQLRSADVKSLSTRLEAARKAQAAKEKRDAQTTKALAESPQWASERVPDAVVDALGM